MPERAIHVARSPASRNDTIIMRLARCAPPTGLRYDALVDAPVTSIATALLEAEGAMSGVSHGEPAWCAYWDQSEELGPYYLHDRTSDAWYCVLIDGPYAMPLPSSLDATASSARIHPSTRMHFIGRWDRRMARPVLRARGASKPRSITPAPPRVSPESTAARVRLFMPRFQQP